MEPSARIGEVRPRARRAVAGDGGSRRQRWRCTVPAAGKPHWCPGNKKVPVSILSRKSRRTWNRIWDS